MKRASLSFFVFLFSIFMLSLNSFAQHPGQISERVQQTLIPFQAMKLAHLLRIHHPGTKNLEVTSLFIEAQSFGGRGRIDVLSRGRVVGSLLIRGILNDAHLELTPPVDLEDLELTSSDEIFIESITAEVIRERRPAPGQGPISFGQLPRPFSTLTLSGAEVRGVADLNLTALVRAQHGLTLMGAEIESVSIMGGPAFGRFASAQVLINNRSLGERQLPPGRQLTNLLVNSFEEIFDLRLLVRGEARIDQIQIRIGRVRDSGSQMPSDETVIIREEIFGGRSLSLAHYMRHDNQLVRSITLRGQGLQGHSAEVVLLGSRGEFLGSARMDSRPNSAAVVHLARPVLAGEIRIQSYSHVRIRIAELDIVNRHPRW